MAPTEGGKKKKKAKAKAEAEAAEKAKAEAEQAKGGEKKAEDKEAGGSEAPKEHREDAYSASSVIFFTRDDAGAVDKVLMAVEERKVQASYIGLSQKGKVVQRMLLFPMGRRERKDKGDTVETAKREYVEETGDFGGLSKYLDFADFSTTPVPEDDPLAELRKSGKFWTGRGNMAVFFAPASMINLFCEVPAKASSSSARKASGGIPLAQQKAAAAKAKARAEAAAAAAASGDAAQKSEEPPSKKQKKQQAKEAQAEQVGNPSYSVGKTDHLEPAWIDAAALRAAVASGERSPVLSAGAESEECRLFPTAASVLRMNEVREWLGVKKPVEKE